MADEVASHRWATGSVPMDVRPIALAINKGCLNIDVASNQVVSTTGTPLTVNQAFLPLAVVGALTSWWQTPQPRPKPAPPQSRCSKLNLTRTGDIYLPGGGNGLIEEYGATTAAGTSTQPQPYSPRSLPPRYVGLRRGRHPHGRQVCGSGDLRL